MSVDLKYTNTGRKPLRVLRWLFLDQGLLDGPSVVVYTEDGAQLSFRGSFGRRMVKPSDYVTMAPGEVRTTVGVNLTEVYELPKTRGVLALKVDQLTMGKKHLERVESDCQLVTYPP